MTAPEEIQPEVIHHLVTAGDWHGLADGGDTYAPESLDTEGFIHFSTTDQVPHTSLRYYADVADLLLVSVDVAGLHSELRWEDLSGTGVFPHLYAPLNLDAVIAVRRYVAGERLQ